MSSPQTLEYQARLKGPGVLVRLLRQKEAAIFLTLIVLITAIAIYEPAFATGNNIYTVSRQIAYTAIVALGVFFVILTGGIDLSVGSMVSLAGIVCGWLMFKGYPPAVAVCGGLLSGAMVGLFNGSIIAYIGVTPFIVTLGTLGIARTLVFVPTHGDSIRGIPESFINAGLVDIRIPLPGTGVTLAVPMVVVVLIAIAVFSQVLLKYTAFGRRVYAVGGNEAATSLSGINTRRVKLMTYVLSGVFSAVTGILYVARFRSAPAESGKGIEMDAIAAAVIGGTSLMGGEGTVIGVLIGATIMGVIRNGLVLMQVSAYWQDGIIGAIIILAAILDVVRSRRR